MENKSELIDKVMMSSHWLFTSSVSSLSKLVLSLLGWEVKNYQSSNSYQKIIVVYPGDSDWDVFLLYLYCWCFLSDRLFFFELENGRRIGIQKLSPEERFKLLRSSKEFFLFIPMFHFNNDLPQFLNAQILPVRPNYRTHRIEFGNLIDPSVSLGTAERIKEVLYSYNSVSSGIISTERLIDYFCFFLIAGIWSHFFTITAILILGTFIYRHFFIRILNDKVR